MCLSTSVSSRFLVSFKVFTRWINTHLKQREMEMEMGSLLRGGLDSGANLWELLAEISNKEEEMPRYNRRPKMRIHKINNLLISLQARSCYLSSSFDLSLVH